MARGRRRAPAAPVADAGLSDSDKDSIDEHIAKRQARLQKQAQGSDSESEPENAGFGGENEVAVCDIELSSSDEDGNEDDSDDEVLQKPSAANLSDDSDEEGDGEAGSEDDEGWRGRRRKNYGADTEEFEIMEDDERTAALQEEEEEALRLQRRALATLEAADYAPEGDTDAEDATGAVDRETDAAEKDAARDAAATTLHETSPELAALINECNKYYKQAILWKSRLEWSDVAKARFHLYSSYATNIAFYFALRTDPEAKGIDVRSHPVVKKIVELRELISVHDTIEISEPSVSRAVADEIVVEMEKDNEPAPPTEVEVDTEVIVENPKKMKTKKERRAERKLKKGRKRVKEAVADGYEEVDDSFVQGLLQRTENAPVIEDAERIASEKRRRLNRITGAIDSEAKNDQKRRVMSADADHIRVASDAKRGVVVTPLPDGVIAGGEEDLDALDDGSFVDRVLKKKDRQVTKKKAPAGPHHYSFKDGVDPGARRRASTQVVLNRGLARYRPKEKKTPRTKNKLAYANAVKRRKGMVRDAVAVKPGLSYAGEASGINVSSRRGARLSDV